MGTYNRDGDDPEADGAYEVIDALLDLDMIRLESVAGQIGMMELRGVGNSVRGKVYYAGVPLDRNAAVRAVRDLLLGRR